MNERYKAIAHTPSCVVLDSVDQLVICETHGAFGEKNANLIAKALNEHAHVSDYPYKQGVLDALSGRDRRPESVYKEQNPLYYLGFDEAQHIQHVANNLSVIHEQIRRRATES